MSNICPELGHSKYRDRYFKYIFVTMLQINDNLKKIRELRNLTQEQFALLIGTNRSTYANWEAGREPELSKIKEISERLGIPVAELIGEDFFVPEKDKQLIARLIKVEAMMRVLLKSQAELVASKRNSLIQEVKDEFTASVEDEIREEMQG